MFDTGNIAFMLLCSALVMLMTPGLAFFYAGLVGRKNVITIMMQSFAAMAIADIIWFAVGYSLCFSGGEGGIIGNLDHAFLIGITSNTALDSNPSIPLFVFIVYQMMVAIITPALISGAFTNRVRFKAYIVFFVAWLFLVYFPFVHMVWGGGLLATWGVKDYGGGLVVHASAGMAALASVLFVGHRQMKQKEQAHNLPLFAIGAALLWFGWFGFNAGNELGVNTVTVTAFFNTNLSASVSAFVWLVLTWRYEKKPKLVGMLTGALAGLVAVTPCCGFVTPASAMVIGLVAGFVCYAAVWYKNKRSLDDALDVWGIHGVGGITGVILLGILGTTTINPMGSNGLLFGGTTFFGLQLVAVGIICLWAFGFTYIMLWVIDKITPVRVPKEDQSNLDELLHGETAYIDEPPSSPT